MMGAVAVSRSLAVVVFALLLIAAVREIGAPDNVMFPYASEPREWVVAVLATLLAVRIVAYVPHNPVGWLFLALGLTAAVAVVAACWAAPTWMVWLRVVTWWPPYALLIVLALVFPDGRPGSRWATAVLVVSAAATAVVVGAIAVAAWSDPVGFLDVPSPAKETDAWLEVGVGAAALTVAIGGLGGAVRLATMSLRATGQMRRWYVWAAGSVLLLLVADALDVQGFPGVWIAGALAFPVAAIVAVVRSGLYDIDLLVHRTLLYGSITAAVLAGYAGLVAVLAHLAPASASAVAAAAAVVAVQPMREHIQRRVDRFVYGDRRNPYEVMSRLGVQLAGAPGPAQVLPTIIDSVAQSLRVPYVGLVLAGDDVPSAEHGESRGRPISLIPLSYQGERVGDLLVAARSPEERFTRPERELLAGLARQLGAVVKAVGLARELQESREGLVFAREEERRRLRRDLHDGLGPTLVGMRMQLHAIRAPLATGGAATVVDGLSDDMARAVAELRTLVDDLRPPALDAGLAGALHTECERFARGPEAPAISIVAVSGLAGLPAAVEVAAYRITAEAVTNVVRHARARTCTVHLEWQQVDGALIVEVVDDGVGLPSAPRAGVGIASMHERAAELGGSCTVGERADGPGCRVRALLPVTVTPMR